MSDRVDSGQPLSILNVDGRSLELDEHGLARLLLDERFKDKHVVVIAVAGAFRKGKSFLLCFLLRYLRSGGGTGGVDRRPQCSAGRLRVARRQPASHFGHPDVERGFPGKAISGGGAGSLTGGHPRDLRLRQNDLQHLQDFLDYGMLTQSAQHQQPSSTTAEVGCTRPFQSLMFLVRDWQFERPYGLEGGRPLLEQRLKGPQNQDRELRQLRRKLSKCFKEMRCFLMPHPGLTVAREGFDGRLSDMDETFKLHLFEFVRLLLNPDNLLPKEINGRKVTCQELFSYIKVYVDAHKKGLLEDPSQMLQAAYHGSCRAAMDKSLDFYTTSMLSLWQNSPDDDVDRETMRRYHNDLRRVAVEKYSAAPKMGGELPAELYLHKLLEKIDATFDVYCNYLKEKKKTFINSAVFKHVAFKVAHGFLTTGLAAAAIALAVVELPIVAIALGAFGAASLSGHLIQAIVEMELAKRKKKERFENSKAAAEAAKSRGIGADDIEECDDETPLVSHEQLPAQDDTCSVLSLELAESASTSPEAPVTVTDEVGTAQANHSSTATEASNGRDCSDDRTPLAVTEAANSAALSRALKHYSDGMQQVCGDSIPRLSEEELRRYHDLLQVYARNILIQRLLVDQQQRGLPHFLDRLTSEACEELHYYWQLQERSMENKGRKTKRGSVSDGAGSGHELQIVRTSEECIELDERVLKDLLLHERVKDKPVAVVSVAGAFRTGKSFLLGFFLRYLQNSDRVSWLDDENVPLRGFEWRAGCERHTTGILVWNEVFLVKTSQGQEIAVLLMDTQGMHDDHSTIKESATIFALSTMMSSVLVYNLSQNIQESDLQYLQLFADYGRLAQQQSAGKPFQKLLFLVRDWYHLRDAQYGIDGGRKLLERRLQISEHQPKQLQELRQYIHSSFTKIDCFLLPHPGTKVATGTSFDGRLSQIEEEFKEQLQDLVPSLLAPDNLTVKKINGEVLTCGEFHIYMKAYVDVFNGGELPEPMSVLQATARANNLAAVFKALKLYTTRMTQRCKGEKISTKRLRDYHNEERENALTKFQNIAKMGGDLFSQPYLEKLKQEIDEWFQDFMSRVALKSWPGDEALQDGSARRCHDAVSRRRSFPGGRGPCCGSDAKEERRPINERVCLVEVHDELLDGPQRGPSEATRNLRRRPATPEVNDFHTIDLEVDEPPNNTGVKPKGKKRNFLKRFFRKKRRNSREPTELDRLKQC
ncbi:hypothetical protein MTO96_014735 [Rhipicephalus appendiculatus]